VSPLAVLGALLSPTGDRILEVVLPQVRGWPLTPRARNDLYYTDLHL
jgi:hypothetical protein